VTEAAIRTRAADIAAAALVAIADAVNEEPATYPSFPDDILQLKNDFHGPSSDESSKLIKRATLGFWMENIQHLGRVPYGGSDSNDYVVFRNVKEYGAVGNGKTDDTKAINKAMKDQGRCGENCGASTIKLVILYFPSGTYLVISPLPPTTTYRWSEI
jgi:hypothetical protein